MKSITVIARKEGASPSIVVTIPRPIVKALDIQAGDELEIIVQKESVKNG